MKNSLLLILFAAAAIFAPVNIQAYAEDLGTENQLVSGNIDKKTKEIVQPAAIRPEDSAKASVKKIVKVKKEITVSATAYTADCQGCSGTTFMGVDLKDNPDAKVIAVDPDVIPLGAKVYVQGYGYATAADIGGGIDGKEIDIFLSEQQDAEDWGRQEISVKLIEYK
jgi:N-acetylmuramoyl-L-alanine amidase